MGKYSKEAQFLRLVPNQVNLLVRQHGINMPNALKHKKSVIIPTNDKRLKVSPAPSGSQSPTEGNPPAALTHQTDVTQNGVLQF